MTNRKSMRQHERTSGNSALQANTKKLGKPSYRKCPLNGGLKNKSHQQITKEVSNRWNICEILEASTFFQLSNWKKGNSFKKVLALVENVKINNAHLKEGSSYILSPNLNYLCHYLDMWTGRLASPRGFEKYKFLGSIPNPLNQNSGDWGLRNRCVKMLSGWFLHTLEIKNHCFISFDKSKLPFWCVWFKSWHLRLHSQKHRKSNIQFWIFGIQKPCSHPELQIFLQSP